MNHPISSFLSLYLSISLSLSLSLSISLFLSLPLASPSPFPSPPHHAPSVFNADLIVRPRSLLAIDLEKNGFGGSGLAIVVGSVGDDGSGVGCNDDISF